MEYYVENKFETKDDKLIFKKVMEITQEIIKKNLNERERL